MKILKILLSEKIIRNIIITKFTEIKDETLSTSSKFDKFPESVRNIIKLKTNDIEKKIKNATF